MSKQSHLTLSPEFILAPDEDDPIRHLPVVCKPTPPYPPVTRGGSDPHSVPTDGSTTSVRKDAGEEKQVQGVEIQFVTDMQQDRNSVGNKQNWVTKRQTTINAAVGNRAGDLTNKGEVFESS